jgi:hypothetical protein
MAKNKTTDTETSVPDFIDNVADESKRNDCLKIIQLMEEESGYPAKMWGTAIVGFGSYHYKYESGHEGDAPLIAFSPRANAITFYVAPDFPQREELLAKLGKHTTGKACIYVKKLADVNIDTLRTMIVESVKYMKERY